MAAPAGGRIELARDSSDDDAARVLLSLCTSSARDSPLWKNTFYQENLNNIREL